VPRRGTKDKDLKREGKIDRATGESRTRSATPPTSSKEKVTSDDDDK
jgi:hypothetical protein